MADLAGRRAVITGAGRGIGRASALLLAGAGAAIFVVDEDGALADETVSAIEAAGGRAIACVADVAQLDALERLIEEAVQALGGIDILVNAMSLPARGGTVLDHDEAEWEAVHAVNLRAPRVLIKLAAQRMVDQGTGGRIVSISSSSGSRAAGVKLAYGASKAALNAVTRIAAAQLGKHDINVNAVAPGITKTPLQRSLRDESTMARDVASGTLENFFNRVSEPEDVAATVLFLCMPASRQITGQVIHTSAGVVV
ncbi:SDR family NAD(P)-dependent oxidoreductase [Sphingomonas soli]|uniref:SDR family NAD(P)-dependent oxidoreductase n=1 Tax=Sphingomonas soli TaxID=266127 RepID=UPI000A6722E9|nr:SDR family oxidoreductase [Sphingomonas soli]